MDKQFLSAIVFWFVLYFGYKAYFAFEQWLKDKNGGKMVPLARIQSLAGLLPLVLLVILVTKWHWVMPAEEKVKQKLYGTPITEVKNIEGKVFMPQAFVITSQRILIYDKDGKVYSLDGIQLDGMKPEQLAVTENTTYTVYRKNDKLFFSKM